jgi:tRNA G18 (ribose-2'-O)-methylase SpoU
MLRADGLNLHHINVEKMRKLPNKELNRKTIDEYKQAPKLKLKVVLDNVRSMNNIGSVFRTSDAFLIEQVMLCGITATPPHNDIRKTALGAEQSVPWIYFPDTKEAVNQLKSEGYTLIAIEQTEDAVRLNTFHPNNNEKYALIFGNEVKGVEQDIVDQCDFCIEIPQEGTKHSLNISVSVGIVIWEFYKFLSQSL